MSALSSLAMKPSQQDPRAQQVDPFKWLNLEGAYTLQKKILKIETPTKAPETRGASEV